MVPAWIPFWGGENFEFFRPIFNIADASISTGIIAILVFQKRFFKKEHERVEKLKKPLTEEKIIVS